METREQMNQAELKKIAETRKTTTIDAKAYKIIKDVADQQGIDFNILLDTLIHKAVTFEAFQTVTSKMYIKEMEELSKEKIHKNEARKKINGKLKEVVNFLIPNFYDEYDRAIKRTKR